MSRNPSRFSRRLIILFNDPDADGRQAGRLTARKRVTARAKFMKILITGTAGFIGFHLAERLAARGDEVVGIDNINDYYDQQVKYGRLAFSGIDREQIAYNHAVRSSKYPNYRFIKMNLEDPAAIDSLFRAEKFDAVCNLAAQAGVRYSLTNPGAYVSSNIVGFMNLLEACRHNGVGNLCYASSSSVYGLNERQPFSVHHNVDHPVSLYAASKKSNELMAHTYSHLYGISTTGLRFFTVYGPWGRPDMALFLFTKAALEGRPIDVFNYGEMQRDFTYIDDIVEGVVRVIDHPAKPNPAWSGASPDPGSSSAPYRVYNIGNNQPVRLMEFITAIEKALGRSIEKNLLPIQPGDVPSTYADVADLVEDLGYKPATPIQEGVDRFIAWYREFFTA
jgi:UDP-glucuronate 4-epimerase